MESNQLKIELMTLIQTGGKNDKEGKYLEAIECYERGLQVIVALMKDASMSATSFAQLKEKARAIYERVQVLKRSLASPLASLASLMGDEPTPAIPTYTPTINMPEGRLK